MKENSWNENQLGGMTGMKASQHSLESILGVNVKARKKTEENNTDPFSYLLLHRQIHGDKIYVPLNISKLWNQ